MKNVSDKLKNIIEKGGLFYAYAKVLFADGTEITLDSEDDFSISDNGYSESGGDDLPLGSALSKTITLSLFNEDGRFSDYDFFYSQITLYTEADFEDDTQERINEGVFYVTSPVATGEVIEITAYDAMYKTNKEFTSQLSYPATARNLLLEVCASVGITVADAHFKNEDFQIQSMPEKTTARKIIGYIAQIAVGNAIIKNGSLSIKSYDFEPLKDVTDGTLYTELSTQNAKYHVLSEYSDYPTVGMNPVTITGIRTTKRVNNEDVEYLNGTDDYALTITNPLITGAEEKALELIGDVLNGVTLTSFSGTFFPYPTAEIMDCAVIVDQNDKAYKTVITTHDFSYPGESELSCGIKDPETNSSTYYSESAEMYHKVQAEANKNRKEMESAIENLQTTLANAKGMYTSKVRQADGSYITYLHDKPTMSESENVIKITSDAVGVSTDGGQTYPYGFFLTGDLVAKVLYAIGINADYINTGALTIRDKDGNITFYADTETGRVDIRAESLAIGGQTLEAIANIAVKKFVDNVYTKDINNLKDQVTNKIETWYQPTDPAVNWGGITEIPWCDVDGNAILDIDGNEMYLYLEESKASHIGDLWKNTTTNEEYRYSESGEWVKMPVPDAVFDEIDGKAQIFINTPSTPYSTGDLWFDSSTYDIMTCVKSRETGDFTSSDWEKRNKYTDDSGLNDFITATYDPIIAQIQARLDGQIENWFYDYEPTMQNYPASEWTTETTRKEHEGDLFYWKSKGYSYRFTQEDATGTWKWQLIQDTDITKALAAAEKAQDTADGKRRVFVTTPAPPYDVGDLWVQGGDGDIMRCKTARSESATFSDADWEKASKYTDDTKANEVKKELDTLGEDLQTQIDGKIETYNQSVNPAGAWTTDELKANHKGDLWYNPDEQKTKRWNGSAWEKMPDADAISANNLAMTKKRVFVTTPFPPYDIGDLWVGDDTSDLKRCVTAKRDGESYSTNDWIKAVKYTDDTTINDFVKNIYQPTLDNVKDSIQSKIETWYQSTDPSNDWGKVVEDSFRDIDGDTILDVNGNEITLLYEETKAEHEGDLWHNTATNESFIYRSGQWEPMSIPNSVFDAIDGKAQIFISQPVTPYDVGDLYFTGTDIKVCTTSRSSGNFDASDWKKKDNYTDDSALKSFMTGEYADTVEEIRTQIDGKAETWKQDEDPATAWTTAELKAQHKGDLWYKTSVQKSYIYNGSGWDEMKTTPPDAVFDAIDGKAQIFTSQPVPPYDINDVYFTGSSILVCTTARTSGSYNSSDWKKKDNYTDDSAVVEFINNTYIPKIDNIQNQIDGKVEDYYYDYAPTLSNIPASEWSTEEERQKHNGDKFYWKSKKVAYIFTKTGDEWQWVSLKDPDIEKAMEDASNAQKTADGKVQNFITQPVPPYSLGDLWYTGTEVKVCSKSRTTGKYQSSDWQKKDNYTDDTTVNDFIENTYSPKIEDIQTQIDGKIDTYFYDYEPSMSNVPASAWTTEELKTMHNGDLFFWKTKGYTYRFLKIDSVWQWFRIKDIQIDKAMNDASNAQDTADSKRRVFVTTPAPPYDVGDLWTQGKSGDLMRCKVAKASGAFVTTDWEKAVKYTDDTAVDDLDKALTQEDIFNRLTNNGQVQGLFLKDGKIYLNFSYAEGGTLKLGGENNDYGKLVMLNKDGEICGSWQNGSLYSDSVNITGGKINIETQSLTRDNIGLNYAVSSGGANTTNRSQMTPGTLVASQKVTYDEGMDYEDYEYESQISGKICNFVNDKKNSNCTLSVNGREIYARSSHISLELPSASENGDIYINPNISTKCGEIQPTLPIYSNSPSVTTMPNGKLRNSSSSSKRYKHSITDIDENLNPDALYNLPVRSYTYNDNYLSKDDINYKKRMIGFIAEEVHEIYPKACQYDDDGRPEMWNSLIMIPAMMKLIQEQNERIKKLEKKLESVENK
nr:MAG TPA: Putative tail protein [Caudoviricetes sp.]